MISRKCRLTADSSSGLRRVRQSLYNGKKGSPLFNWSERSNLKKRWNILFKQDRSIRTTIRAGKDFNLRGVSDSSTSSNRPPERAQVLLGKAPRLGRWT